MVALRKTTTERKGEKCRDRTHAMQRDVDDENDERGRNSKRDQLKEAAKT